MGVGMDMDVHCGEMLVVDEEMIELGMGFRDSSYVAERLAENVRAW
jgi:hypothetical protein